MYYTLQSLSDGISLQIRTTVQAHVKINYKNKAVSVRHGIDEPEPIEATRLACVNEKMKDTSLNDDNEYRVMFQIQPTDCRRLTIMLHNKMSKYTPNTKSYRSVVYTQLTDPM